MNFSSGETWTVQFPISLAVEGDACYDQMARLGVGNVLFCTVIYAPYRLVLPRYPRKGIYSMEEGKYHYLPEANRYCDLPVSPVPSGDFDGRDMLAEATAGARKAGLGPGAWVTVFANGKIAKDHTDWTVRNLYDSADRLFLCFNNPEVREYSLRVCAEVAARYELDEIMLDKIPQSHLEMDAFGGIRIDPVLRILGSLCFCPHCKAAAAQDGIDLEDCCHKALALGQRCLAIPPHVVNSQRDTLTGDMEAPLLLLDHPWIMDLLRWRHRRVRGFLDEVRKRIDEVRSGLTLSVAFVPPVQSGHDAMQPRPWLATQSYAAYKDSAVDLIHSIVHWDEDALQYDTHRAADAVAGGRTKIVTHVRAYGPTRPEQIPRLVEAVHRGGADGLAYFCYDLMSDEILEAISRVGAD